ncbi:MAG: nuclear transport factor 2 family protein [Longimicrobiaceae bacterium]
MRPSTAALSLLLALQACDWVKVERTPSSFYTQRDPARVDQRDDSQELRARVRNFADELARGHRDRALTALNPGEGVLVIGPAEGIGVAQIGVAGLAAALDSAGITTPAVVRTPDLRVEVALRERTGWFSAPIQFMTMRSGAPAQWLRVSGVFAQERGEWKLVEIHLSRPWAPPAPAPAPADSAANDSARRGPGRGGATPPRPAPSPARG